MHSLFHFQNRLHTLPRLTSFPSDDGDGRHDGVSERTDLLRVLFSENH